MEEPWAEVENEDVCEARLARRDALARAKSIWGLTKRNVSMQRHYKRGSRALVDRTRSCGDGKFVWHFVIPSFWFTSFVILVSHGRMGHEMVLVATSNRSPVL